MPVLLKRLRADGYYDSLPLGWWYPASVDALTIAVTERRRTKSMVGWRRSGKRLPRELRECPASDRVKHVGKSVAVVVGVTTLA